jgi:UDP-N-acetylmuramoyl-L-alanyl-D-glutamate--2,6-diaminopimelate ligase
MHLHQLLLHIPNVQYIGATHRPIRGVAYDSRKIERDWLFVAVKGYHVDGHTYIAQALERGAGGVVVDARFFDPTTITDLSQQSVVEPPTTFIIVPDSRVALAPIAAAFYGFPSSQLGVVGVTGTKGKTTTTMLTSQLLEAGGHRSGFISTVDFKIGERQWANDLRQSTPEALEIQQFLRTMVDEQCDYAVLESSSHALSPFWNRLGYCGFDVAVFTNVTHEHLDYHGTVDRYRQDKARLFSLLSEETAHTTFPPPKQKQQKYAIVNADDPHHRLFLESAPYTAHGLAYGIKNRADVQASNISLFPTGSDFTVDTLWGKRSVSIHLPGAFNISNSLAALTVALSQGVPMDNAIERLEQVAGIRGRMERIDCGQPFEVIVDYAHNPDSFEQVMGMIRPLTRGQMIAVFGSAGERDKEKRPVQGEIAARYCHTIILTDEDPRGEDREAILAEIAVGVERQGKRKDDGYFLIPDRASALREAISRARAGDVVLLLGKGHEGSIEYHDGKRPWDESQEARTILQEYGYST